MTQTHIVRVGPSEVNTYGYRWTVYIDREKRVTGIEDYKTKRRSAQDSLMHTIGIAWKEFFLLPPSEAH